MSPRPFTSVLVYKVLEGSSGAEAGLRPGDELIELDGKAHAEQQREQRESPQGYVLIQKVLDRPVERRRGFNCLQELFENRDAKFSHDIDSHDAEQRQAAKNIQRGEPVGGSYGC